MTARAQRLTRSKALRRVRDIAALAFPDEKVWFPYNCTTEELRVLAAWSPEKMQERFYPEEIHFDDGVVDYGPSEVAQHAS